MASIHTSTAVEGVALRPGTIDDAPQLLRLADSATEWLVKQGRTGQWGTQRPSDRPDRIQQITAFAKSGGLWLAVSEASGDAQGSEATTGHDNEEGNRSTTSCEKVLGALCVGEAMPYVKPATEPELYIRMLLTDRSWKGRGLGSMLLSHARKLAREAGVPILRLDCYAGDDGKLVRYYETQGFEKAEAFEVKGWPGQVLVLRLE